MHDRASDTQPDHRGDHHSAARRPHHAVRGARWALRAHLGLTVASLVALASVGVGAMPAWLAQEPYSTAYQLGWRYTGPACIALGVVAIVAHAAGRLGAWRAAAILVLGVGIAYAAELSSTSTGWPFGHYVYTSMLGPLTFGLVPLAVPLSWCLMAYAALALAARIVPPGAGPLLDRLALAAVAAVALLAWDLAMDPAMSRATAHWTWEGSGPLGGGPVASWAGWLGTGTAIGLTFLAVAAPERWRRDVAPDALAPALYAANGAFAIVLCALAGLWPAALAGTVAMGALLVAAHRGRARLTSGSIGGPGLADPREASITLA